MALSAVVRRVRIRRAMTRPNSGALPPRGRLTTGRRKLLVLDLLSQGHTLAQVKKALGINRVTVYRWRQHDPSFARAYSEAMEAGAVLELQLCASRLSISASGIFVLDCGGPQCFARPATNARAPRASQETVWWLY
jgi:transposase-like protein